MARQKIRVRKRVVPDREYALFGLLRSVASVYPERKGSVRLREPCKGVPRRPRQFGQGRGKARLLLLRNSRRRGLTRGVPLQVL